MFKLILQEKNGQMEIDSYEISTGFLKNEIFRGKVYAKLKDVQLNNVQDSFMLYYSRKIDFSNILLNASKTESNSITLTNKKGSNISEDITAIQHILMKKRFLCSVDEHYIVESIKKTGKIEIPPFLLVSDEVASKTIQFEIIYNVYHQVKNSEKFSFIFDLYFENTK